MVLQAEEFAATGEAAIDEVQADGGKDAQAVADNPLAVRSAKVELTQVPSRAEGEEEYPTEDERHTLRRVPGAIPWQAYLVAFCELAERFSYYGCTQVFQTYIQRPRPDYAVGGYLGANTLSEGKAGALDQGQRTATALTTFNSFYVYVTPLFGAYLADSYLGRYKTICIAVAIATIGHIINILNGIPSVMDNQNGALGTIVLAILVMGIGTGFFKSNVSTLIAEQIPSKKQVIRVTPQGERVILDPALTIARLFMYFYLAINIGAILGQIGMSYAAKYEGFWLAFTLPTIVFLFCIPVLYFARNRYIRTPPSGSVLPNSMRLLRLASKGRWSLNPVKTYRNMKADDFWTSVLPSRFTPDDRPRWMTFDDQWVLEVRRGFKACAVFTLFPLYWLCYNQINNNLTSQAQTMQLNGTPPEITAQLDPLFVIVFVPILDRLVYPGLRKMGFNFTPLKRICAGFFMGSFSMVYAAVIQNYIYKTSPCGDQPSSGPCDLTPAPISMWAQSGCYCLIALSELFASVTGLEYAFTKAPKNMKSLVMSVYLFQTAIANAIGLAITPLSGDPLLVINYGLFAGLSFVGGCLFWIFFRKLDKEEDALNNMADAAYGDDQLAATDGGKVVSGDVPPSQRNAPEHVESGESLHEKA